MTKKSRINIVFSTCYVIIIVILLLGKYCIMDKNEIKNKVIRLKEKAKTFALTALIGGSSLTAHAAENTGEFKDIARTETVTKHLNGKFTQKTVYSSNEQVKTVDGKVVRDYKSALQNLCDLGEGYFMTSSQAIMQKTENEARRIDKKDVLYLTTPGGKVYDCSFLHDKGPDFLPVGFEKGLFIKTNGEPDTEKENKLIKEVKETVGVDEITPEATIKYNTIMAQKKLEIAKDKGIPNDAVAKVGIYLQQELELLHTGKTYIASIGSFSASQAQAISKYSENSR